MPIGDKIIGDHAVGDGLDVTSGSGSVSIDALIHKTGITKTVSLDAALQAGKTGSASLDASAQIGRTEPADIGGYRRGDSGGQDRIGRSERSVAGGEDFWCFSGRGLADR